MIISRGMETSACMAGKTRRGRPGRKNPCKTGMISGKTAIECPNPQALPALSGVLRQGTLSAQEEERKVFTGGRKNNSLPYFLIFYSMSLHSAPSIVWELSGEPCETRDQALSGIKNNTEAFIICSRGDEFLQATCNSPENYHCEISFAGGKDRELYMTPKDLDYSRLHDLFSRYAAGEDLSHLKKEWTLDAHKPGYITAIVVVLAIIAVLAVIIFSS
ncbi:hypothetical protein ADH72_06115 [Akkermansia muciniphila]|uniref:Uncharacterized protein n=3 Tax=Akkermansiaceae TaxID=1647988 RepID=A0AAX0WIB0_9BACT|nr:hypothetical protein A4V05_10385 [Akkermansia muciniphila]ASB35295.1 hypothetical protein ADH72_06115 [Akkermansia muciniphila]PND02367.1 hypothetical protein CXT95_06790 [Akkermansia muciniphila]